MSLLEAAYRTFSENGFHGSSLRDVTRRCDTSLTTLLHHYPHKADLLIAVLNKRDSMFPIEPDKPPTLDQLFMSLVETARRNEVEVGLIRLSTVLAAEAAIRTIQRMHSSWTGRPMTRTTPSSALPTITAFFEAILGRTIDA